MGNREKPLSLHPLKFKEAVADLVKLNPPEKDRKPCECGCGGYPKKATSRFLPGHDLKKAYSDTGATKKPTK
jgi:hypothetical protein